MPRRRALSLSTRAPCSVLLLLLLCPALCRESRVGLFRSATRFRFYLCFALYQSSMCELLHASVGLSPSALISLFPSFCSPACVQRAKGEGVRMYASHFATEQAARESTADASSLLPASPPNPESSWQQESSSPGGWQAAPPNLIGGWQPVPGSSPPHGLASSNGPPGQASLGAGDATAHASSTPAQAAARMLLPAGNNGIITPQPPPAASPAASPYSAVADEAAPAEFPAHAAAIPAVGGLNSSSSALLPGGEPTAGGGGAATPPPAAGRKSPSASPGTSNSPGTARAAAKKKPRGPRKKKPKVVASSADGPVRRRRVIKVKKARPAEVPLGEGGRERAMDILRLLAGSPLSEEFRKPVVQLHPEVRVCVCAAGFSISILRHNSKSTSKFLLHQCTAVTLCSAFLSSL